MAAKKANFVLEFKETGIEVIEKTIKELEKMGITATEVSKAVDKGADKAADAIEDLAEETEDAGDEAKKTGSKFKKAFAELSKGAKSAYGVTKSIGADLKKISLISFAAAATGLAAASVYSKSLIENLDKIALAADKVGVSIASFAALTDVSKRFGQDADFMADKLIQLNEFVSEAAKWKSGSGFEVLNSLNLDAEKLAKLDPVSQLREINNALAKLSDVSYRKQLESALSLDDMGSFLNNNFKMVDARIAKLNRTGLNLDDKSILKVKDTVNELSNDLTNFSTVVLTEVYKNLNNIYGIEANSESILNKDNAKDLAKNISSVVNAVTLLAKALGILGTSGVFVFKALAAIPVAIQDILTIEWADGKFLNGGTNLRERKENVRQIKIAGLETLFENGQKATDEQYDAMLKQYDDLTKNVKEELGGPTSLSKAFSGKNRITRDDIDKFVQDSAPIDIGKSLNDSITSIVQKVDELDQLLNSDGMLTSVGGKNVLSVDIEEPETIKTKTKEDYQKELLDIQKNIDYLTVEIQIQPDNEPVLRQELEKNIKNKQNTLAEMVEKFPYAGPGFELIDVKNAELELKQSEQQLEDYYKNVKAKNKEAFDEQSKMFTDSVNEANLSFDLDLDNSDYETTRKKLEVIFKSYESFVKNNGTYAELLQVQTDRASALEQLKSREDAKMKDVLALESMQVELLQAQGKEIEANDIKRQRSFSNIKKEVENIDTRNATLAVADRLFKFDDLNAIVKELKDLETKLDNVAYGDTNKRLELEGQIADRKSTQIELQKELGVETDATNEKLKFTVAQVKELNIGVNNDVVDGFTEMAVGAQTFGQVMEDVKNNFLKNIAKMIIQQLYFNAIAGLTGGSAADAQAGKVGLGSLLFSAMPTFHTGIGGGGSTSSFQPQVQVPGLTNSNEGLAVLQKGERISTVNQQYNEQYKNNTTTNNQSFYMDGEQLSSAVFNSNTADEAVLKIITKNKNTIKSL